MSNITSDLRADASLPPVVAGTFYPGAPDGLRGMVQDLLNQAPKLDVAPPKALILPHAGYRFSGAVAAAGIAALSAPVQRVVVLGPSHRHAFRGVALPDATAMETPLGSIPLDRSAMDKVLQDPDVAVVPAAFAQEHAIEVELPFLQIQTPNFSLVPLVVGDIAPDRLAEILEPLWGGPETLIVISTDLTHFLTADQAAKTDLATAQRIEIGDSPTFTGAEACGHRPLAAFLSLAQRRGMRLTRLALTHSGHVTGDMNRVVGYGAWMAHEPDTARLSPNHRAAALRIARQTLDSRVKRGKAPAINMDSFPAPLQSMAPAFVTLTMNGRLRGCIGSLKAHQPLAQDILNNTVKAGFHDPRFNEVTAADITKLDIEIAILSAPAPIEFSDEADLIGQLCPGRDGLILIDGRYRGTFLPKVWDSLETPEKFLSGLKVKAGLARDHWSDDLQVLRYVTESFAENRAA